MDISTVREAEIDQVMDLIHAAVEAMEEVGLHQWSLHYPSKEIISADVATGTLLAARVKGKIAGIIVLNEEAQPGYKDLIWDDPHGRILTVHRLGVHPGQQKQGVAKALMNFAAEYARKNKYSSIRLDTSCKNTPAIKLYQSLNYRFTGTIDFGHGDFRCYEKVI